MRFGSDKSLALIEGKSLISRILSAIPTEFEIIIVGPDPHVENVNYCCVQETPLHGGPVAGIQAGLTVCTNEIVALMATDMPFATARIINLFNSMTSHDECVMYVDGAGKKQPMPGYAPPSPTRRTRRPVNVPSRLQPSSTYWIWPRLCDRASMSSLRVEAQTTGRCSFLAAAATNVSQSDPAIILHLEILRIEFTIVERCQDGSIDNGSPQGFNQIKGKGRAAWAFCVQKPDVRIQPGRKGRRSALAHEHGIKVTQEGIYCIPRRLTVPTIENEHLVFALEKAGP